MEVLEQLQVQMSAFHTQMTAFIPLFCSSTPLIKLQSIEFDLT